MKGFTQLGQQLLTIWKELGTRQRVPVALAGFIIVVGMAALVVWSSRPDYALLYGRLDDGEAAKVIAALDDAKVPYRARGGGTILVPGDKVHVMRMQLASKGIPRGDGVGFEIFDKPNFGISDFVQRANYLRAVQGELARTISQVDMVEAARVMVVVPENRLLVDSSKKPTASVFVRVRGNGQLPPQTVNAIRFLVANAVEGLQANNVSIIDNLGNVLTENNEGDSVGGLSTTQLAARKNVEQYLSRKAEGMLEKVLGSGQAVVRVSAEINFDTLTRTEEKFDPEGQVLRNAEITDDDTESVTANGTGGVPGVEPNVDGDTNSVASSSSPSTTSHTRKKRTNNQYEINKTTSATTQLAGGLKRVTAAVFVAAKTEGTGAAKKLAPRSKEEIDKLKRIVQSALGVVENDPTRKDEITLEETVFNDQPAAELAQQLDKQQRTQLWWDIGRNAVYPVIAAGLLFFFWRTFKRTPAETIPIGVPVGQIAMRGNGNGHGGQQVKTAPGVVTVDVLNQLIRENPNNFTQAVRSWMTKGKAR